MPSSSGRYGRAKATRDTGGRSKAGKRRAGRGTKSRSNQADIPQADTSQTHTSPTDTSQTDTFQDDTSQTDTSQTDTPQTKKQPRGAPRRDATTRSAGQGRRRVRRMRTVDETSAGGLVVDSENNSAAVIGRLDRRGRLLWSLPKGHIENGETAEQAAVREVAEETGIAAAVVATLGSIDYWFVVDDHRVHKTVHHFLLRAHGGELSDADLEVTEVAWVPLTDLPERLAYADERRLVRRATDLLANPA